MHLLITLLQAYLSSPALQPNTSNLPTIVRSWRPLQHFLYALLTVPAPFFNCSAGRSFSKATIWAQSLLLPHHSFKFAWSCMTNPVQQLDDISAYGLILRQPQYFFLGLILFGHLLLCWRPVYSSLHRLHCSWDCRERGITAQNHKVVHEFLLCSVALFIRCPHV